MSRLTRKNVLEILGTGEVPMGQLVSVISIIWGIDKDDVKSVLLPLIASGEIELTANRKLRTKPDDA